MAETEHFAENSPLLIARQGSIEAGGDVIECDVNDGGDPCSTRWPGGHIYVDQVHASYQYPVTQRYPYPILFNAGGGHSARVYDTTPDGREGWLTQFLRRGFAVYGVDRVNSGRSGLDIRGIIDAKLGRVDGATLPAMNRYPFESCWETFRWGPKYGIAYEDTQFPIEAARDYYLQTLPNVRDPEETQKCVAAFTALIDKIGAPVILQTWSSSGLLGYLTAIERPESVKAIIAIETSTDAFDNIPDNSLPALSRAPILIVIGDRAQDRVQASRAFQQRMRQIGGHVTVDVLPDAGIHGNGHTLMLEKNNREIMHRIIGWLEDQVFDSVR